MEGEGPCAPGKGLFPCSPSASLRKAGLSLTINALVGFRNVDTLCV